MKSDQPFPENRCLSTLRVTNGNPWSRGAITNLWNNRTVSPFLDFELPDFHRFRRDHSDRISISGVQDKISLKVEKGKLIPTETDGEYLLKPIPSIPGLEFQSEVPANEHVTMQIASQIVGIEIPPNGLVFFPDGSAAYVVKRFDRDFATGKKQPQEDFCQLSGRTKTTRGRNFKYDGSYEEMGRVLRQFCPTWQIEIEKLFRLIVFNYIVGNGDAHFKNFSLVQTPFGDHALSPAYDLLNTNLHLPAESRTALDLFDGDFETDSFRLHGFYTAVDFRELASRFLMKEKRTERILKSVIDSKDKAKKLLRLSLLSENARDQYEEILSDHTKAIIIE